jgi:tape measure domain-containing protein
MTTRQVSVRLVAEGGRRVRAELQGIGEAGQSGFRAITREVDLAAVALRRVAGLVGTAFGLREIVSMTDRWTDLGARVALATRAQAEGSAVMARLAAIARRTYSSLDLTVESYLGNATALRELGLTTAETLDFTEALNNALVVSGAKAERAASVQNALSKAMALGRLSGDELNTVIASGGRVAELLAAELGTTVSGLRGLGQQGEITGAVIRRALVGNLERLRDEADSMPATIGDAFTLLGNAALVLVGRWDGIIGASSGAATAIIALADNLDRAAAIGATFAALVSGRWVAGVLAARLATLGLAGALTLLRGAIIRTGVGALIVGAGELLYQFGRLVAGAGGFGVALGLLRDVAVEVWDRIGLGAAAAGAAASALFLDLKADAAMGTASAIRSVLAFGDTTARTFEGALMAVRAIWSRLPDVIGDLVLRAANRMLDGIEAMLNGAIARIDAFTGRIRDALAAVGIETALGGIGAIDLGEIENPFAGASADAGSAAAEAFRRAFEGAPVPGPGDGLDMGLEATATEALAQANIYRRAAEDLGRGARAPLASWAALRDALAGTGEDGAAALDDAAAAAGRVAEAMAGAGAAAGGAGTRVETGWAAVAEALRRHAAEAADWGKGLGEALVGAFRSAETAFREFVKTGKLDFRGLVSSILEDLAVLQLRNAVLGPIASALSSAFSASGGSAVTAAVTAAVAHAGGMVGLSGYTRQVPALAFAGAPRMHSGGTVAPVGPRKPGGRGWAGLRPDEVPTILQRGERVLSRREVAAGTQGAGPQHLAITVNVEGARGNREIEEMVQTGVAGALRQYDRLVAPRTLARVSQDPRRRG